MTDAEQLLDPVDPLDPLTLRAEFPIFERQINGKRLVYLDSANTSQKPAGVIEAMRGFAAHAYAPINRSAYTLAAEATEMYEGVRAKVRGFVNATHANEIVFVKNATEAINLVARAWGGTNLGPGDAVLLTQLEHHANIVPWHILAAERGFQIRWVPLTADGQLDLADLDRLLDGVKLFAFSAMSNVLGTITPVAQLCRAAHRAGALALVDACQLVPHHPVNITGWRADFVAFSSHKMCGPTGVGVLWGRHELLEEMPPFLGGGNMIADVSMDGFTAAPLPHKFEAGTPPIIEVAGLGAAIDFLHRVGMEKIHVHEVAIGRYFVETMSERFGDRFQLHGPTDPTQRGAVFSFNFAGAHPHDVSQVLDSHNVCVRAGHHCAKPLMRLLGTPATVRASAYLYNDTADIDALADALAAVDEFFPI